MADQSPFAQLTGTLTLFVAPEGEAAPLLSATPAGNWTELGQTDGDQAIQHLGTLTAFSTNDYNAPVKHVRSSEGLTVTMNLVDLTLENLATAFSMPASAVVEGDDGTVNTKTLPNKRGYIPERFALLLRGGAVTPTNTDSPYGAWPAQQFIPQVVMDGEPTQTRGKDLRPEVQIIATAEVDMSAAEGLEFGELTVQMDALAP